MSRKMFIIGGIVYSLPYILTLGVLWAFWKESILWAFIGWALGLLLAFVLGWFLSRDIWEN